MTKTVKTLKLNSIISTRIFALTLGMASPLFIPTGAAFASDCLLGTTGGAVASGLNATACGTSSNTAEITIAGSSPMTNADNIAVNAEDVATNSVNIAINALGVANNANNISVNAGNISTNSANVATNTANIGDINQIDVLSDLPPSGSVIPSPQRTVVEGLNRNTQGISQNSQGIALNTSQIGTNTQGIALNTAQIGTNTAGIASNLSAIQNNLSLINFNTNAIGINTAAISEIREGNAAIASIPDLYLTADETWTIAGGVSLYDDGFGGSETGFGGGFQVRSSNKDKWSIGVAAGLTPNTQVVRVQGRFGA